jgi:hypothetical protein
MGPRGILDTAVKRKIPSPRRESNPGTPIVQPVAQHYTDTKIKIYKTVILSITFNGREIWSITLREEHRLVVFENWVLRRIFGPKMEEVVGG